MNRKKEEKFSLRDFGEAFVIAVVLAIVIRTFFFQFRYIPTKSMVPNLNVNDRIGICKICYALSEPERGDIVTFKYPLDRSLVYVKRLIGEPGDTVEIKDSILYINDEEQAEDYLPEGLEFGDFGPYPVPEGEYFMMGDNRNNSNDSRYWGTVERSDILGEVKFVYWPPGNMKWVE